MGARAGAVSTENYMVAHYNINNGLPHNFVDNIYRDSNGFVWISLGGGGLARFDGYEYLQYSPSSAVRPIAGDFVKNVVEDAWHRLWVATDNGLTIIDLETLMPLDIADLDDRLQEYQNQAISEAIIDTKGRIWMRHNFGIDCLSFNPDGEIEVIDRLPYSTLSQYNAMILRDATADGNVWTGIDGNVVRLSANGDGSIGVQTLPISIEPDALVTDVMAKDHIVWIATDKGLIKHTRDQKNDKIYRHSATDAGSLSQDVVTSLAISPEGYLVASTLNGLNFYDPATDSFSHITAENTDNKLNSNFVNCMLVDGDNFWVGTETGGLNLFYAKNISSDFDTHQAHNPGSLSHNPVNALYEDTEGTLWVGVVEGGLNRRKVGQKGFERYTAQNSGLNHNSVSTIAMDGTGRLWIGTWGGGVDVLDARDPKKNLLHMLDFEAFGQKPYIGVIIYDALNDGMWIGTSYGIYFYDLKDERLIEPVLPVENTLRGCIGAAIDKNNHLWIGTMDGLCDIDLETRSNADKWSMRTLNHKLDAPQSKVREKVSYVFVDSRGILWVASDIHGLYKRINDEGVEKFVNITADDGLVQNVVMGIAEDGMGRLWVSTNKGLSCYYPDEGRFVNYTQDEGLGTDLFYWNAAGQSHNGNVMFGAVDGLLTINSTLTQNGDAKHRVAFTRLMVDNEPVAAQSDITRADISMAGKIKLHERNKSFSVEFSALDYAPNPAYHYYYKLEGFDKNWVMLPHGRHFVTYTNIPAGKYKLLVSYHPDGVAPDADVTELEIEVQRYFYHTLWFMLLMLAVVLLVVWSFWRWRMQGMKQKKEELEQAVAQRTAEIERQKQMLEERTMRIQELTVERLSFFTNLTHEFRTPITLIMGPVHRALQLCKDQNVADQLHYVERNAKYLLNLVNQLMDFRKIESGKMDIVRKRSDFRVFLDEVLDPFRPLAKERGIELVEILHMANPEICFDKEAVRKLLTNLLSNAVKYTPDDGRITIYAALLPLSVTKSDSEQLYICVSDTGDGISPDDIDKVFNRFYQGKSYMKYPNMQASSGIGLHLCKCIVEAYGGHISVRNNPDCGCRFRIVIPVPSFDDEASVAAPQSEVEQNARPGATGRRLTVLVIEDNADMRGYIKSVLAGKYEVLEAENGEVALKTLISSDVDFIICDLMMPVMDGMEFARKAKENFATSHIPILMLTARTSDESKLESYRSGVDDYISKPFSEELLLARIDNILANKQRHQRQFAMDYNTAELQLEESRDKKFLDQVMEVLKENYQNSYFDMGDFAEALGVSRSVLNKKLQSLVGQSSNEFVRNYRLNLAYQMIVNNRQTHALSISEIAYDVGFNDSKYFTRCFTKHFGITPSGLLANEGGK